MNATSDQESSNQESSKKVTSSKKSSDQSSAIEVPGSWLHYVDLAPLSSFGVAARARYLVNVEQEDELPALFKRADNMDLPVLILGGGSNILLTEDFSGLVMRLQLKGIQQQVDPEHDEQVLLSVAAGENWHELVCYALAHGCYGLENLALIPGSVGAAPVQNIGAYGVELSDLLVSVRFLDIERLQVQTLQAEQCHLAYRDSIFKQSLKNKAVILSCTLRLHRSAKVVVRYPALLQYPGATADMSPQAVFDAVCDIRRSKLPDPQQLGNAGSFFRNPIVTPAQYECMLLTWPDLPCFPVLNSNGSTHDGQVKIPAAWLIEHAGWKGHRRGDVGVHDKQALVLVNYGHGSGQQLLQLAKDIAASVQQRFGIQLQPEVSILPAKSWP